MKLTRSTEGKAYEVPGHYEMKALRLHNPDDVQNGTISLGLSHFLPRGGASYGKAPMELIYFVLEGEMTVKTDEVTYELKAGDSIHFVVGEGRESVNNTSRLASMLVIAGTPASK